MKYLNGSTKILDREIDLIREIIVLMRNAVIQNLDINEQNQDTPIPVKNIIDEKQKKIAMLAGDPKRIDSNSSGSGKVRKM